MTQGALLLALRRHEGQLEDPPGSNWGKPDNIVVLSLAFVGIHEPASWCAALFCYALNEANGDKLPDGFRKSASALHLWELNPAFRVWEKAKGPSDFVPNPEDAAIYDHGHDHGHIDVVETTVKVPVAPFAMYSAIGGNTNKGGGRQGIGVFGGISRRTDDPLLKGFLRFGQVTS